MKKNELFFYTFWILIMFGNNINSQITNIQTDNFEDGTVQNWLEGSSSPNLPLNIADGGPSGVGDNYLQNISSGGEEAGSRLVMFNTVQWKGDYISAGVTDISMYMKNFGTPNLEMRLAFDGSGGKYSSTNSVSLSAGSGWQIIVFSTEPSDLTSVGGTDASATLGNVTELRILHNATPSWRGASIVASLGVDYISASEIPVSVESTVINAPQIFQLEQNYPNPFNPSTMIKYGIPEQSNIKIEIFNMLGQSVGLLVNGNKSAGYYEIIWNAENLPSGIYLISIRAEGLSSKKSFTQVKKALLLK